VPPVVPYVPGCTFTIQEPSSPHAHLYIVLAIVDGSLIAVPLNTITIYTDQTLILTQGDHPFISHDSSVSFDRTRDFPEPLLHQLEAMGPTRFTRRETCSKELLSRLQEAAFKSDMIKPKYITLLAWALNR
jgi:hypothetical protein